MTSEEYIYHHGVKGMKWGVRKAERKEYKQKKRQNPSSKKTYNKQIKQRKKTKYTDIRNLSNKELQDRVNRMNLERQYSSLLKTQKKAVSRGKADTKNLLERFNTKLSTLHKTNALLIKSVR